MNPRLIIFTGLLILFNIADGQIPDSLKYISLGPAGFQKAYQSDDQCHSY